MKLSAPAIGCPVAHGEDQQDAVGHALADEREEGAVEIGPAPFARAGVHVEVEEGVPGVLGDVAAGQVDDLQSAGQRVAAFAADRLALARGERVEEVVEVAIALVDEVELAVGARQVAGLGERCCSASVAKVTCSEEAPILPVSVAPAAASRRAVLVGVRAGPDQQAPAGHRREGHRRLELGIVAPAGALIGVGPAMVEDVFAHGMALQVAGHDRRRAAVGAVEHEVLAEPAGLARGRAGFLQRPEEIVRQERVVGLAGRVGAGVPVVAGDVAERGKDTECGLRRNGSRSRCSALARRGL